MSRFIFIEGSILRTSLPIALMSAPALLAGCLSFVLVRRAALICRLNSEVNECGLSCVHIDTTINKLCLRVFLVQNRIRKT